MKAAPCLLFLGYLATAAALDAAPRLRAQQEDQRASDKKADAISAITGLLADGIDIEPVDPGELMLTIEQQMGRHARERMDFFFPEFKMGAADEMSGFQIRAINLFLASTSNAIPYDDRQYLINWTSSKGGEDIRPEYKTYLSHGGRVDVATNVPIQGGGVEEVNTAIAFDFSRTKPLADPKHPIRFFVHPFLGHQVAQQRRPSPTRYTNYDSFEGDVRKVLVATGYDLEDVATGEYKGFWRPSIYCTPGCESILAWATNDLYVAKIKYVKVTNELVISLFSPLADSNTYLNNNMTHEIQRVMSAVAVR